MHSPLAPLMEEVTRTEMTVPLALPSPSQIIAPVPEAPTFTKVGLPPFLKWLLKLCK